MSTEAERAISSARRRRGVAKASITRVEGRVAELEARPEFTADDRLSAQQSLEKLNSIEAEFKSYHLALVDLLDEDAQEGEQRTLDEIDDKVACLVVRLQRLVSRSSAVTTLPSPFIESKTGRHLSRRLNHLDKGLQTILDAVESIPPDGEVDACLLHQYEEQLSDLNTELANVLHELLSHEEDDSTLSEQQTRLSQTLFDVRLKIRRLLQKHQGAPSLSSNGTGVKLPKLSVPTFDGNIVNWRSFWEQFTISVHDRANLSLSEKLTYLKHAVKDGAAKHVVEGLSASGNQYEEAIDCLCKRYDRPRLLHQTHVRAIVDAPSLKDGSGKELRRLHDTANQHLRALKAMDCEPSGQFITSLLELKLDPTTMFEWQKYSQGSTGIPHFSTLLEFLNLRAQASESSVPELVKKHRSEALTPKRTFHARPVTSMTAAVDDYCFVCNTGKHPLYGCPKFRSLPHDRMMSLLKSNGLCLNCLKPGHFLKECTSTHRCRKCQKPHHTLLHVEAPIERREKSDVLSTTVPLSSGANPVHSHVAQTGSKTRQFLLMTCRVLVMSPDGFTTQARALLDSASSASFVSERLAQHLHLPRHRRQAQITGVGGLTHQCLGQSVVHFSIKPLSSIQKSIQVEAIVLPKVTSDLPLHPVSFGRNWHHLSGLCLADPDFGSPSRLDLLLGVDIFSDVMLHGRRSGLPGTPTAFETCFGWVLAGAVDHGQPRSLVVSNHASVLSTDDLLRKFWETEELSNGQSPLSAEERFVVTHFQKSHHRDNTGRFVVPLPRRTDVEPLGESRSLAVRRFVSIERSLHSKGKFQDLKNVVEEYFELDHAEPVPEADLDKPCKDVFYLPMHIVVKESSTTSKIRAVFDASAKSSTGVSLNDQLLVGPTVYSSLIDVLLRFRHYRIALTTDVSRMYRAILLPTEERDLHRFVWRRQPSEPLKDYRMTRVTFGVASSSFAANMSVKQNAIDHAARFPLAAAAVHTSFYVDDGLVGAHSLEEAIELQTQLQSLFACGGFLLRKWKASDPDALQQLSPDLLDSPCSQAFHDPEGFAKALGIEWSPNLDCFRLTVSKFPCFEMVTKRALVSDVAKTFDILGWFAPAIVKVKILLQRLWEAGIDWDDSVPLFIQEIWERWRSELPALTEKLIPRCYFPKDTHIVSVQLHGFCDASESAYAAVVYLRMVDHNHVVHVSLVMAKSKVAPLKRLTIPRLELCGATLLAELLHHVKGVLDVSYDNVFAWTDSTIVLSWLSGNPRRFKVFVGNRVSTIIDLIPSNHWYHVAGLDNPADSASRGMFPLELLQHELWWTGPNWLRQADPQWPCQPQLETTPIPNEEREISLFTSLGEQTALPLLERFSSFSRLIRVTAWIFRFVGNCRSKGSHTLGPLSVDELLHAERYWITVAQQSTFREESLSLRKGRQLDSRSRLLSLHPMLDAHGLIRVGGRCGYSSLPYSRRHPVILPGSHGVTKLIIQREHLRLLHAGPTQVSSMLSRRFHILRARSVIRSITRACVVCRRISSKPKPQMLGQLPSNRLMPGFAFERVGVDYAGPVLLKGGSLRKPVITKAYISVFVCFAVKAVHLELVSDLTSEAFIRALRRFISRRGKPSLIWSDNGTNFVGAAKELKAIFAFLQEPETQRDIFTFCTTQSIDWKFIPERAPHFGGLWEAAVKSMKLHLRKVIGENKLTFEEYSTVLHQVEACLNSRPICPLPDSEDGIDALTPGHFLIGRPLEALPDPSYVYQPNSMLRRWQLCQLLVRQFWQRWSNEYFAILRKFTKWNRPERNLQIGDLVCLHDEGPFPTKWPLARVVAVHPGNDGLVRVITVKTARGTYKRPVTKAALVLPCDSV